MTNHHGPARPRAAGLKRALVLTLAALALGACGHLRGMRMQRPAESEFGLGPRASAGGGFTATLEPADGVGTRRMHSARLTLHGAGSSPVEGAQIQVDGGMPQHGHGLPTAPRVTRGLGGGAYQVEGLRFNMPGWWELKFRVTTAAGTDSVTFNLAL